MIEVGDFAFLLGAGALAGLIGTAGGITSLVSYPSLLAVGLHARPAGIVNIVALVAAWPGSAISSQPELRGRAGWLWRFGPVAAIGGAVGAGLLLLTPGTVFERLVPFLVLIGAVALLSEPRLTEWRARRNDGAVPASFDQLRAAGLLFGLSVYNGYFGAGAGIMVLTLMLVIADRRLTGANALKNMLIGAATAASALIFVLGGSVTWAAVLPLALGILAGGSLGPQVTRRLPPRPLRIAIGVLGIALAVQLWVDPGL